MDDFPSFAASRRREEVVSPEEWSKACAELSIEVKPHSGTDSASEGPTGKSLRQQFEEKVPAASIAANYVIQVEPGCTFLCPVCNLRAETMRHFQRDDAVGKCSYVIMRKVYEKCMEYNKKKLDKFVEDLNKNAGSEPPQMLVINSGVWNMLVNELHLPVQVISSNLEQFCPSKPLVSHKGIFAQPAAGTTFIDYYNRVPLILKRNFENFYADNSDTYSDNRKGDPYYYTMPHFLLRQHIRLRRQVDRDLEKRARAEKTEVDLISEVARQANSAQSSDRYEALLMKIHGVLFAPDKEGSSVSAEKLVDGLKHALEEDLRAVEGARKRSRAGEAEEDTTQALKVSKV